MAKILRIFGIWMIFVILAAVLLIGFELVNKETENSGFSSGEVFVFENREGTISGEIFGKSFSADIRPAEKFIGAARIVFFFLPPPVRLFMAVFSFVLNAI